MNEKRFIASVVRMAQHQFTCTRLAIFDNLFQIERIVID